MASFTSLSERCWISRHWLLTVHCREPHDRLTRTETRFHKNRCRRVRASSSARGNGDAEAGPDRPVRGSNRNRPRVLRKDNSGSQPELSGDKSSIGTEPHRQGYIPRSASSIICSIPAKATNEAGTLMTKAVDERVAPHTDRLSQTVLAGLRVTQAQPLT